MWRSVRLRLKAAAPRPSVDSNTHVGWTAGAGVEFAVTEDVSLDLLYKYTDYGTQDYTLDDGDARSGLHHPLDHRWRELALLSTGLVAA